MKIKQMKHGLNWVDGKYGKFYFQAKIYVAPSDYGINNGRVSKLIVSDRSKTFHKQLLLNYDRGWDFGEELFKEQFQPLLEALEMYAQLPEFTNQFPSEGV